MRILLLFFTFLAIVFNAPDIYAQSVTLDIGENVTGGATERILQIVALITVLSLAPSILIMVTSFTRIIVVLSLLRSAIGIQQSPPNAVLINLALFLTFFIMMPVLEKSYDAGIKPMIDEKIDLKEGFKLAAEPFHEFMLIHVRDKDLELFTEMSGITDEEIEEAIPYRVLIPSFMISELRRAFEIGFLIFVPFVIVDMMVASTLMSMGMMMLPPVLISLPFKLVFFVLIDGWYMLSDSLIRSYGI